MSIKGQVLDPSAMDNVKSAVAWMENRIAIFYQPLIRAMTGNDKIKVVADARKNATNGRTVWLAVPLALGRDTDHIQELCGKRDDNLWMLCPRCAAEDEVHSNVCHEACGHIVFDSFVDVSPELKRKAFVNFLLPKVEAVDPSRVDEVWERIKAAKQAMEIASVVDAWLPLTFNVVEDVFVNKSMYADRPGTWQSMYATDYKYLTTGTKKLDGTISTWADAKPDQKAIMALYSIANDYHFALDLLGDEIKPVVRDPRIQQAMSTESVLGCKDAGDRLSLACDVLGFLRDHGFGIDHRSFIFKPPPIVIEMTQEEFDELDIQESTEEPDPEEPEVHIKITDADEEEENEEPDTPPDTTEDETQSIPEPQEGEGDSDESEGDEGDDEGDDSDADGEPSTEESDDDSEAGESSSSQSSEDSDEEGEGEQEATSSERTLEPGTPEYEEELDKRAQQDRAEAEEATEAVQEFMGHGEDTESDLPTREEVEEQELAELYINQKPYFDETSTKISGLQEVQADENKVASVSLASAPTVGDIQPSLIPLRVAFTNNKRVGIETGLRHGPRLSTKHLFTSALDDPTIFGRKHLPVAKSWAVCIGLDVSGSTAGGKIDTIKRGGYAMAELLNQCGIAFSVFAHSGVSGVVIVNVKNFDEPWGDTQRKRCMGLQPFAANLDGHTMEFYRKQVERQRTTDKLIMYFTDGRMPLENFEEELQILQREIILCKQLNIKLVGVGVGTDSPRKHGLDTVRYDSLKMLPDLVNALAERLK